MYLRLFVLLSFAAFISCQSTTANAQQKDSIYRDIDLTEFSERMQQPEIVLLDVRTPKEVVQGSIPGAVFIDYNGADFKEEVSKLDKSKTYLVYCAVGGRSGKSCSMMQDLGFREVYNLKGGYRAWSATK